MIAGAEIVAAARGWLGTPYLHQASCRGGGTDCLGLLRGVWREVLGTEPAPIPAYTADWSEAEGREDLLAAARLWLLPAGDPAAGDVLLFRMRAGAVAKHLGIASDTGDAPRFIHAYSGHAVVETALSAPWRRRIAARFRFPERA
ncbi:NlpC/P60 family protein [Tabrizicola fusiformis]|uniref:NlpC/P60 family protein n=1 Tax=Tabrizicola sp. SY72 TaxID=2741673 RepID=UPI001572E3F0|nr:NlpC/P60 family protein [Tabrizicola sp. SY72]NTT86345.1 peptidase [Tabrizicola sp. SY72]